MLKNVYAFISATKQHACILAGVILILNVMISCNNPAPPESQSTKDTLSWVSWDIRYHQNTTIGQINQSKEECLTLINKLVDSFNQVKGLSYETTFDWSSKDSLYFLMKVNLVKPGSWDLTDSVIDPRPPCPRPGPGTTSIGEIDYTQCIPES